MHIRALFILLLLFVLPVVNAEECPGFGADTIRQSPIFLEGVQEAWRRSTDESTPRENGFNIYQCYYEVNDNGRTTFEYKTELDWYEEGGRHHVPALRPRPNRNCRIVAWLHTHPEDLRLLDWTLEIFGSIPLPGLDALESQIKESEPSPGDEGVSNWLRAPAFIVWKQGENFMDGPLVSEFWPLVEPQPYWRCGPCEGNDGSGGESCPIDTGVPNWKDPLAPPETFGPPQPVSTTDPHLITLDGLGYDFHGIGEFVLITSEVDNLEIQARQQRYGGPNSQVSVNSGFAFNVDGQKVSLVRTTDNAPLLFVNDEEQNTPTDISLTDGGIVAFDDTTLDITWSDGSRAIVSVRSGWMNLSIGLNPTHAGKVSGLLGNFDGDTANDFVTSSGDDLSSELKASDLYGRFLLMGGELPTKPLSFTISRARAPKRLPTDCFQAEYSALMI